MKELDWLTETDECTTSATFCYNCWIVVPMFSACCGAVFLDTARNSSVGRETLTNKATFWSHQSVTVWLLQFHWVSYLDSEFLRSSVGGQLCNDALVFRWTAPLQLSCAQTQLNQSRNTCTQYNLNYLNWNDIPGFELNLIGRLFK